MILAWFFILMQIKLISTRKVVHFSSFCVFGTGRWPIITHQVWYRSSVRLEKASFVDRAEVVIHEAHRCKVIFWRLRKALSTRIRENIRFQSSPRIRNSVRSKDIYFGERFQKDGFSMSGFSGFVWTEGPKISRCVQRGADTVWGELSSTNWSKYHYLLFRRHFWFYFYFQLDLRHHNIKTLVIKQSNKKKVAGILQQREPVTGGPENLKI